MTEERDETKLSQEEIDAAFDFGDKTIATYEEEALLEPKEYDLEVASFTPQVKVLTEDNMTDNDRRSGAKVGDRIPYLSIKLKHARDKNGKISASLVGRRHDMLMWDLRREETRDDVAKFYLANGYDRAYVPKYKESEFITSDKKGRVGRYYIGVYTDNQTKTKKNSRPRPVVGSAKAKKQAAADASKGDVEL